MRLSAAQLRRLQTFLEDLYPVRDLDAFVSHVVRSLPELVRSELTVYGELNIPRRRFSWLWEPVDRVIPDAKERFRAHVHEHPFAQKHLGGGDGSPMRLSDVIRQREFERRGMYNEVFRPLRIRHEIVLWLANARSRQVNLALHREREDFPDGDKLLLTLVRPHVVQAYRNAEIFTDLARQRALLEDGYAADGRGVLILDATLKVRHANPRAVALLAKYFGAAGHTVPPSLAGWLHRGRCAPSASSPPRPISLVLERGGDILRTTAITRDRGVILVFEERSGRVSDADARQLGLTRREVEVLRWIAEGKDNATIAQILGTSSRTVEKHVEAILEKLGVENRTAAAARLREGAH